MAINTNKGQVVSNRLILHGGYERIGLACQGGKPQQVHQRQPPFRRLLSY